MECGNANESDTDGELERKRPRVKPPSTAFESHAQAVRFLAHSRLTLLVSSP